MEPNDVLLLKANEILSLVANQELELIDVVRDAYLLHSIGQSSLPNSTFLHFPFEPQNRIIALPAYLNLNQGIAGIKWVSSFPDNINNGLDRASAILILNSTQTGRPQAILEGAIISAKRTAGSAALAAQILQKTQIINSVGIVGCGFINFEVVRFLLKVFPSLKTLLLFDIDYTRADIFKLRCQKEFEMINVIIEKNIESALSSSYLVSFATTASAPYINDISMCKKGTVFLHISLRDLSAEAILSCSNIVDDIEHVCRAQTSIQLTEQLVKHRNFITGTIAEAISGNVNSKHEKIVVFSPFGLGILDIAVGKWVFERALINKCGTVVKSFLSNFAETNG